MVLEKYNFNKDIEVYSNNSYYADSDEEYDDEKFRDLFLETIRKIWWIYLSIRKNIRTFFKLGTLKFPPEI